MEWNCDSTFAKNNEGTEKANVEGKKGPANNCC
jgi:hypothetical protein